MRKGKKLGFDVHLVVAEKKSLATFLACSHTAQPRRAGGFWTRIRKTSIVGRVPRVTTVWRKDALSPTFQLTC
jgi:hypothetical protein